MNLCLGTVQFGLKYGIANKLGKPTRDTSLEILHQAYELGIREFDTANAYGDAEEIMGCFFNQYGIRNEVSITSKLRPNCVEESSECNISDLVELECQGSLKRMGIDVLDHYLFHTPGYIYHDKIMDAMVRLKKNGLVKKIGVSIYDMKDGEEAMKISEIDTIQLPVSVFDQRSLETDFFARAKKSGKIVNGRSAFLQGLFFMPKNEIPMNLIATIEKIEELEEICDRNHFTMQELLLRFVISAKHMNSIVFGVDTLEQLKEDIEISKKGPLPTEIVTQIRATFNQMDESIIIPSLWAKGK